MMKFPWLAIAASEADDLQVPSEHRSPIPIGRNVSAHQGLKIRKICPEAVFHPFANHADRIVRME